jgi:hypothetical protein
MRQLRTSHTFDTQLLDLLEAGAEHYARDFLQQKRRRVFHVLSNLIVPFPALKRPHPELGLVAYPVSETPFVVLYDFDDVLVRAHFIVHKHADLEAIDPTSADW